jgi:hypothetical protein
MVHNRIANKFCGACLLLLTRPGEVDEIFRVSLRQGYATEYNLNLSLFRTAPFQWDKKFSSVSVLEECNMLRHGDYIEYTTKDSTDAYRPLPAYERLSTKYI